MLGLTVDRLVATWNPHGYRAKSKPSIAKWATLGIVASVAFFGIPAFMEAGNDNGDCTVLNRPGDGFFAREVIEGYFNGVALGVHFIVPVTGHVVLDGLILFKLLQNRRVITAKEKITASFLLACLWYLTTASIIAIIAIRISMIEMVTEEDMTTRQLFLRILVSQIKLRPGQVSTIAFFNVVSRNFF